MISKIQTYLKFLRTSVNQHGVHSPFVYDFLTKCLYKKNGKAKLISTFRKSLSQNKEVISTTDYGAGSKVFKGNLRKVSAIAKNAGISSKRSRLLFETAQYFKVQEILEIGTSLGIATASLSLANPKAKITTLEGCQETARIAKRQFRNFDLNNIDIRVGNFKNTLPEVTKNKTYDLIYFDGNHQKKATIAYFERCLSTAHNESVFIFDDIHWSKGMEQAWNYIKDHHKVSVSIDTYQWGIVFFRKEQQKEHFTIRV